MSISKPTTPGSGHFGIYPLDLAAGQPGSAGYLQDRAAQQLLEFFKTKGLLAIKSEDRDELWYQDWVDYQAAHGIYGSVLAPQAYASRGQHFDLLRYARFMELFAYLSPGHGYSLQVSFLGLFSVLLGSNEALKGESVGALEAGKLLAFGISEKAHGSDLLANEFSVTAEADGGFVANGSKYYIGNANAAAMVSILGHLRTPGVPPARQPFVLLALRPPTAPAFRNVQKIRTLGVRASFVGSFEVEHHEFTAADIIAQGRAAWDAVFGTVTLGKFFLGVGSIGICEHAFFETLAHVRARVLYGKPVLEMPHIGAAMAEAFTRLTAMKLYAYRALDYLQTAAETDRRYLLFCAVQKAQVSTQAVKVVALLSQCAGARGFESDTYLEMALRDVQLIPGLEGSMHINLRQTTQFAPRYYGEPDGSVVLPPSLLTAGDVPENGYLYQQRTGHVRTIGFRPFLEAYHAHAGIPNVGIFARQAAAFRRLTQAVPLPQATDSLIDTALGRCMALIVYGQLIAEEAELMETPGEVVSLMFSHLVADLSQAGMELTLIEGLASYRSRILPMIKAPCVRDGAAAFVSRAGFQF